MIGLNPPPADLLARLAKRSDQHKYDHGHALVLAGGVGRGGAARLAARAALRVGAGLVTVAPPPAAIIENAAQLNAIMLRAVAGAGDLRDLLKDGRLNALCLGPGLGIGEGTRALVLAAFEAQRSVLLDADAITSFSDQPEALFAALGKEVVLTPHAGEFARLFPMEAEELRNASGEVQQQLAVLKAAKRARAVVLLKGEVTLIADPTSRMSVHRAVGKHAVPWLATAGSGDVLAGLITGLMARGFAAFDAAGVGAWLHAEAARLFGPGLIAEDIPEMIPQVLARMDMSSA